MAGGHGGDLEALARCAGRAPATLLDFSANINPLGMPASARAALLAAVDDLGRYPDPRAGALTAAIAAHHGIEAERIVPGNGAEQLIWWLPRLLGPRRVRVTAPCYLDYRRSAALWGLRPRPLRLRPEDDFGCTAERLDAAAADGDLVWLGQPNNPTGRLIAPGALRALIAARPAVDWAVDEAFIDFAGSAESAVHWNLDNLVVVRSMTKFYALPGLRLGYAVLAPARAARLRRLLPDWSVNRLADAAGTALLRDPALPAYAARSRALVTAERARLSAALRGRALRVFDGAANFLLLQLPPGAPAAPALAERLLHREGIAVRVCADYQGLDDRYLRIAVRTAADNDRLLAALPAALGR